MGGEYSSPCLSLVTGYLHRGRRAKRKAQSAKRKEAKRRNMPDFRFALRALLFALHQSFAQGLGYGFGFGMDLEFVVDVLKMKRDRAHAYAQLNRRGFVAVAIDDELQ